MHGLAWGLSVAAPARRRQPRDRRSRTYVEGIMRGEDAHGAVSYAERSRLGRLFRVVCSAACWCVRSVSFSLRYMLLGTLLQQETFAH